MTASSVSLPGDLPRLPRRAADAHKYDFGRVLLVGGSVGMTGAITLSGLAALRSGAGLVQLAVPGICWPIVAGFEPSFMTLPLATDGHGEPSAVGQLDLLAAAERATSVGCGPGLAPTGATSKLVAALYANLECPAVFDAGALASLSEGPLLAERRPKAARVLTPHAGEFRKLLRTDEKLPRDRLEQQAVDLAKAAGIVILLKGHRTLITDGHRSWHNTTGNPGMATGGTGDVLTGIVAALLGQKLEPYDAARLAAWVHGRAGDLAAAEFGETSLIASDLPRFLPQAFREVVLAD